MPDTITPSPDTTSNRPRRVRLSYLRFHFTFAHLWRSLFAALMVCIFVVASWSTTVHAASLASGQAQNPGSLASHKPPRRNPHPHTNNIAACPSLTSTPKVAGNVDGLGTVGFYTLVKQNLDDRLLIETNVANGNLVAQYTALQIRGTGLDLDIAFTYNSQSTTSSVLGPNWNLSVGNGVSLSFNGNNVTLHGSSGVSALYTYDTSSYDNYDEPAGLDATLVQSTVNGASYVLIFQKTSECFGFDSHGREIFDQDKNGHQITFLYNSSGNISSLTDTQNRTTTFGYNSGGLLNQITDVLGRTVQPGYQNGMLTSIVDLNGKTTTLGYTGTDLTSITDPDTNGTSISYQSGTHRVNELTDALSNHTFVAYYAPGASQCGIITSLPCTVFTDARSNTTIYGYSGLEVQQVVDGNGNLEQRTYTPDANVSQYTDPLLDKTVFNFDVGHTNNLLSITDGTGATTTFGYTNPNPYLPTTLTDAQNNTMTYGYDSNGNLTSATDTTPKGTGSSASYQYNTDVPYGSYLYGTLKQATDGDGNPTTYTYDSYGNLHIVTPPAPLGQETITVDQVSRVTQVIDGNGTTITFSYDPMDRLKQITYNTATTIIHYGYNDDGDQTSVIDNTGTTSFNYDQDNRLHIKTLPNGDQITTTYDPVGNLHLYTDRGGSIGYDYDNANRLLKVEDPPNTSTPTVYGYNPANERTSISYPNGTGEVFGYDKAGHVTSAVGGIMNNQGQITTAYLNFTYVYTLPTSPPTPTQLLQSVTLLDPIGHTNTFTRNYSYDSMNRLTNAEVFNSGNQEVQDWGYSYDKAGNRKTASVLYPSTTTNYNYNGAEELTSTVQGSNTVNYYYDGNGNLTSSTDGYSYSYNAKNQTTAIDAPGGNNSYTYSGPDQTERVQLNGTSDTYSGLGLSYETTGGSTTYYTRCSCGLLVDEKLPSGSKYYYLFDGLGSIVGLTNSSGSEVNAYDYDPYGVILNETTGVANPFQYAGGYFESSTGLVKFGTRYYNPPLGRWTQQDPVAGSLGNPDSLNRYLYAKDDPVNMVDPSGRQSLAAICIAAAAGGILALILATLTGPGGFLALLLLSDLDYEVAAVIGCITGVFGAISLQILQAAGI